MSMTTNSYNLPPEIQETLASGILATPTSSCNYALIAEDYSMPTGGGNKIRFVKPSNFTASITPLNPNGLDPAPMLYQETIIDAAIQFYGGWCAVTTEVLTQSPLPQLALISERLGVYSKLSQDLILGSYLQSASSKYFCTNGLNGDYPTEVSAKDLSIVHAALRSSNADYFLSGIEGEPKFGTSPLRSSFFLLASTAQSTTFDNIPIFKSSFNYPSMQNVLLSEYGNVGNFRILTASNLITTPNASKNGSTIYNDMAVGRQSVAAIKQDQWSTRLVYQPPIMRSPLLRSCALGVTWASANSISQSTWIFNVQATI